MNITLSSEAWAAIALIIAPIVAEVISTMRQGAIVRVLTEEIKLLRAEMSMVKETVSMFPTFEGRILRLEKRTASRRK